MSRDICPPWAYALAGTPTATLMGLCLYGIEARRWILRGNTQSLRRAAGRNQQYWIYQTFRTLSYLMDIDVRIVMDDACAERIRSREPLIVLSNHRSYMDVLAIGAFLRENGRQDIRWIIKEEIGRWPFIGHSCRLSGSVFVSRDKKQAHAELQRIKQAARTAKDDSADFVLFPEGTRFTGPKPASRFQHALEPNPLIVSRFLHELPGYPILSLTLSASERPQDSPRRTFTIRADMIERPRSLSPTVIREWLHAEWLKKDTLLGTAHACAAERLG